MPFKKVFSLFLTSLIFISSCIDSTKDIEPKYSISMDTVIAQISTEITFTEINIEAVQKETTGGPTNKELTIWLTNAAIKSYTKENLNSLSQKIASLVKKNITNSNNYDWLNIIYLTEDGSKASDSTDKTAYVFRPNELK